MIEFIKGIANGIVLLFTAGVIMIAGVILPSPTPTPPNQALATISTSTSDIEEAVKQGAVITDLPIVTPTPIPIMPLVASVQYSYRGKSATVEISMPENGGKLTGSIKGLCNGTIEGIYQKENSTITGVISGECSAIACCGADNSEYYKSSGEFNGGVNLIEKVIKTKSKGRIYPPYFRNGGHVTIGEMNLILNIQ